MAEGIRGDFKALDEMAKRVAELGDPKLQAEWGLQLGTAALKALDDSFRKSVDPYDKPWKPLALRDGLPLLDTGRTRGSFHLIPYAKGFGVMTNVYSARTHQLGAGPGSEIPTIVPVVAKRLKWKVRGGRWYTSQAVNIPKRQMIPQPDTGGMGDRWGKALNAEAEELMRRQLKLGE